MSRKRNPRKDRARKRKRRLSNERWCLIQAAVDVLYPTEEGPRTRMVQAGSSKVLIDVHMAVLLIGRG